MVVDVDEAGDDVPPLKVRAVLIGNRGQNFGKSSVFHAEGAMLELTAHENIGILIPGLRQVLCYMFWERAMK